MSTHGFIRGMIDNLDRDMDKLAHELAGSGREHMEYLIGVGKYRQMKSIRDVLRDRLKRNEASEVSDPEDDDVQVEVTSQAIRRETPRKISKPRPWGGGR